MTSILHPLLGTPLPLREQMLATALVAVVAFAAWRGWRVSAALHLRLLAAGASVMLAEAVLAPVLGARGGALGLPAALLSGALQTAGLLLLAVGAATAARRVAALWLAAWLVVVGCAFAWLLGVLPPLSWRLAAPAGSPPPNADGPPAVALALVATLALMVALREREVADAVISARRREVEAHGREAAATRREVEASKQSPLPADGAGAARSAQAPPAATPSEAAYARRERALQRILQISLRLNHRQELSDLLDAVVDSAVADLGYPGAVLRTHNPRTHLFEARAFKGIPPEQIHQLSNSDVSMEDFSAAIRAQPRLGPAYLLGPAAEGAERAGGVAERGLSAAGVVVLPLRDDAAAVLGYLAIQPRVDGQLPPDEAGELLDLFANQAALAIQNAHLHGQLERKSLEVSMANEKLRDLNRLKGNFVATVSHELRTPLTSIKAYSDTLQNSLEEMGKDTVREFVSVISAESERLTGVIDDILDVSRLESGRTAMAKEPLQLRRLCEDVAGRLNEAFRGKGLRLVMDLPPEEVSLPADAAALDQLLLNLLDNALKFTPEGGEVRLSLRPEVSVARLIVEDSGIGIPEEEMERIFDRFYQVDGSNTRPYGGQGLGLAICRDIVTWHDGRIWVERAGGRGTRFVVLLPRKELIVHSKRDDAGDVPERLAREEFLQLATTLVAELMGTRIASLMMVDAVADALRIEAAVGLEEEVVHGARVRRGEGIAGRVWSEGHSILVQDLRTDPRFSGRLNDVQYSTRSLLSAPLRRADRVVGVLNVNNKLDGGVFDEDDRLLLEAIAERLVRALDSFDAYRSGYRRLQAARDAMQAIVDVTRDRWSGLRELVAHCGMAAARHLDMQEADLRVLSYVLHTYDLGLAQVGEQILRKIAPLSAEDRERIDDHVRRGAELAAEVEPLPKVRQILYHHHENVDGSGYPDGLQGEAIPVAARLVRLADVFSALLHDRPFRRALELDEAIGIIREGVGRRFCPRVSAVFLQAVEERRAYFAAVLAAAGRREGRPMVGIHSGNGNGHGASRIQEIRS